MTTTKTYFVTDKLETPLPANFLNSQNKKYIEIQNVNVYNCHSKKPLENAFMHVNFIHDRPYLDNLVVPANHVQTEYKTYEFRGNDDSLVLWFTEGEPSVPTTISEPKLYKNELGTRFDYENAPDYQVIKKLNTLFREFFTKSSMYDWLNKTVPSDTSNAYTKAIKAEVEIFDELYPAYYSKHPIVKEWLEEIYGKESYTLEVYSQYLIKFYRWFLDQWVDKDFYDAAFMKNLVVFSKNQVINIYRHADSLIKTYWKINELSFEAFATRLVPLVSRPNEINELNMKYHFTTTFEIFTCTDKEALHNMYLLYYDFYLGLTKDHFALDASLCRLFEAGIWKCMAVPELMDITRLKIADDVYDNTISVQDIVKNYGFDSDYTANFVESDSTIAKQFLMMQLCQIMNGKEQKEEEWYSYRRRYENGELLIDQLASDSLTGKMLTRTVTYQLRNTPKIATTGQATLFDFSKMLPYNFHTPEFITVCEMCKFIITDEVYEEFRTQKEKSTDSISKLKKLADAIIDNYSANDEVMTLVITYIKQIDYDTIDNECAISLRYNFLSYYYDNLIGETLTDAFFNVFKKLGNDIFDITDSGTLLEDLDDDHTDNSKYSIWSVENFAYLNALCLYENFVLYEEADIFYKKWTYSIDEYVNFRYWKNHCPFGHYITLSDYEFIKAYYHHIEGNLYRLPTNVKPIDFYFIAKDFYNNTNIKNDIALYAPEYKINFSCADTDIKNEMMFIQITEMICGKKQAPEVWTEIDVKVVGDEEIHTDEAIDSLTGYTLRRERRIALDGFPNEQTYFDATGDEKYNYRFLAEFMLIY